MPELLSDIQDFPRTAVLSERVHLVLGLNPSAFTGPGTNTYLVGARGGDPVLIDTGSGVPEYLNLLREHLAAHGVAAPRRCLLTHAHGDHIGGAAGLSRLFPELTFHKLPWPGRDERYPVILARLGDEDTISGESYTIRAIHAPGHAQDHLCYYLEEERALFTGDVILGVGTTVIPLDGGDLGQYLDTLRRLQGLDLARLYPGHGPVIETPREKIASYLEHRLKRERQILDELGSSAKSVPEIVQSIYRGYPAHLHGAAGQSVLSHLLKLEREGRVARDGGESPRFRLANEAGAAARSGEGGR
jgi:glyoxylase-like metal-dependent hydrolase (beta-lactamase superfamily II)